MRRAPAAVIAAVVAACGGRVGDGSPGSSSVSPAPRDAAPAGDAAAPSGVVRCGSRECAPARVRFTGPFDSSSGGSFEVGACCIGSSPPECGVSLDGFARAADPPCQPLGQPGSPDASCNRALAAAGAEHLAANGCCRADGRCGVRTDAIRVEGTPLGCVDARVVLDVEALPACDP